MGEVAKITQYTMGGKRLHSITWLTSRREGRAINFLQLRLKILNDIQRQFQGFHVCLSLQEAVSTVKEALVSNCRVNRSHQSILHCMIQKFWNGFFRRASSHVLR